MHGNDNWDTEGNYGEKGLDLFPNAALPRIQI